MEVLEFAYAAKVGRRRTFDDGTPVPPVYAVYEGTVDGRYLGDVGQTKDRRVVPGQSVVGWTALRAGTSAPLGGNLTPWLFLTRDAAARALVLDPKLRP
jgi:hypothetical protein